MTASISISINRPGGTSISGTAQVADELVADIAAMLGALIFDGAAAPATAPAVLQGPAEETGPSVPYIADALTAPAPTSGPALGDAAPAPETVA